MTRVKICGITRPQDAIVAAQAGADAIGLVFADSPRQVTANKAREIVSVLPPFVCPVGVFVNARASTILRIAQSVGLGAVQIHGDESPAIISTLAPLRVIKALRVRDRSFVDGLRKFSNSGASAILLDAFSTKVRGGSGKHFDWDLVADVFKSGAIDDLPPIILAGGLTPDNVRSAIRRLHPWGVDVSSGVEESPGIKSVEKIERFIAAAQGS